MLSNAKVLTEQSSDPRPVIINKRPTALASKSKQVEEVKGGESADEGGNSADDEESEEEDEEGEEEESEEVDFVWPAALTKDPLRRTDTALAKLKKELVVLKTKAEKEARETESFNSFLFEREKLWAETALEHGVTKANALFDEWGS